MQEQHLYKHEDDTVKFNIEVEKNSRGYNWKVVVLNVSEDNTIEALHKLETIELLLKERYGDKNDS